MPLAPNQNLFEFQIIRRLGQGAFGVVYLAHDSHLDRPAAIKELTITTQTDELAFKRFIQEARAAGSLNHPHIVTVYSLKVVKNEVYLVMEYLAGGSLRDRLERQGPLPIEEASRIAADVADGLAIAHAKGIVHRDIKPENILLTENGRAKVSDFGIAHVPRGAGGTALTQSGFQPGTMVYMSPEQIRGKPVDGRSDVYQLGAVLYEMLTGRHYVDMEALERRARESAGANVMRYQARLFELLDEMICERGPESLGRVRPDVPATLAELVMTILSKQVEARPTTGELVQALGDGKRTQKFPTVNTTGRIRFSKPSQSMIEQAENYFKLGQADYEKENHEQAVAYYSKAIELLPNNYRYFYHRGRAYHARGERDQAMSDYDKAIILCNRIIEKNPSNPKIYYQRGQVFNAKSDIDRAIADYSQAIQLQSDFAEAYEARGDVYNYKKEEYKRALADYSEAIRLRPNHYAAYEKRAQLYNYDLKNDKQAIADYTRVIQLKPDYASAYEARGRLFFYMAAYDRALQDYNQAVHLAPSSSAYEARGELYRKQGDFAQAMSDYLMALQLLDDHLLYKSNDTLKASHRQSLLLEIQFLYFAEARVCEQKGDYCRALNYLDQAIAVAVDGGAYRRRGEIHAKMGDYHQALADLNQAIRLEPKNATNYASRAEIYEKMRNYKQAIADYEQILIKSGDSLELKEADKKLQTLQKIEYLSETIRYDPYNVDAYYARAEILFELGDYEQAISDYNILIRLLPDEADQFLFYRGFAFYHVGNYDQAINDLSKIIKKRRNSYVDYWIRGQAYEKKGDRKRAIQDFKAVLKYCGNNTFYLERAKNKIRELS